MTAAPISPDAWANELVAFIGRTMSEGTIEDVQRGRALVDAMPAEGLPGVWRDLGDLLGTWVRRREQMTRVVGFHVPLATMDRALADMPQAAHAWQGRKDLAQ